MSNASCQHLMAFLSSRRSTTHQGLRKVVEVTSLAHWHIHSHACARVLKPVSDVLMRAIAASEQGTAGPSALYTGTSFSSNGGSWRSCYGYTTVPPNQPGFVPCPAASGSGNSFRSGTLHVLHAVPASRDCADC
eukprot:228850-Chlamydomonas_euryale.AAC.1